MKFLYTNVELNMPQYLSYAAALPCNNILNLGNNRANRNTSKIVTSQCLCMSYDSNMPMLVNIRADMASNELLSHLSRMTATPFECS